MEEVLKRMDFVLKMMDFVLNMVDLGTSPSETSLRRRMRIAI